MSMTLDLYEIGSVILGGNSAYGYGTYGYGLYGGNVGGQIRLGPLIPRVLWTPGSIIISTPSNNLPQFFLYRNGTAQANLIGASINGNSDQVPFVGTPLSAGEFLVGQWVGGDPGVQATMVVTGSKRVPGTDPNK